MSTQDQALTPFPARGTHSVLNALFQIQFRAASGQEAQVPYATFHLYAGRDISGWLLDMAEDHGRTVVMVQRADQPSDPGTDVCYFDAAELQAVTVHNAFSAAEQMDFDPIELAVGAPASSLDELYQRADEYGRQLSEMVDGSLTIKLDLPENAPDRVRHRLASGMEQAVLGLQRIIASQLGQAAINTIHNVRIFANSGKASADIVAGMLLLDLGNGPVPNEQTVRKLIMSAL